MSKDRREINYRRNSQQFDVNSVYRERSRSPFRNERIRDEGTSHRHRRQLPGTPPLGRSRYIQAFDFSSHSSASRASHREDPIFHPETYTSSDRTVTIKERTSMRNARDSQRWKWQRPRPVSTGGEINKEFDARDRHTIFFGKLARELKKKNFADERSKLQKNISFFELEEVFHDGKANQVIRVSVSGHENEEKCVNTKRNRKRKRNENRLISRTALEGLIDKVVGEINEESRHTDKGAPQYQYIKGQERDTANRFVKEINSQVRGPKSRLGSSCAEISQAIENSKRFKKSIYKRVVNKGNANYMLNNFIVKGDGSYNLEVHEVPPCQDKCALRHEEVNDLVQTGYVGRHGFFSERNPSPCRISAGYSDRRSSHDESQSCSVEGTMNYTSVAAK